MKVLCDSGASDDFVSGHFVTTNRLSMMKREVPLPIQQAVKGSKPKSNAMAQLTMQFGEWIKKLDAYMAGLDGYDAIFGIPTMYDGDAIVYIHDQKIRFRALDIWFDCTVPEEPPAPSKRYRGPLGRAVRQRASLARSNGSIEVQETSVAVAMVILAQDHQ